MQTSWRRARYRVTGTPIIHVVGDSHSRIFEGVSPFLVHHLGPATAFKLGQRDSTSGSRRLLDRALRSVDPGRDQLLLVLGEIDCRIHVHEQYVRRGRTTPLATIICEVVDAYVGVVTSIRSEFPGTAVLGIPPGARQGNAYGYPNYADPATRAKINREFDRQLASALATAGVPYRSMISSTAAADGLIRDDLTDDGLHLNGVIIEPVARWLSTVQASIGRPGPSPLALLNSAPLRRARLEGARLVACARRMADGPEMARWRADDGEHLRLQYPLAETSIVLDVGGYEGQWASDIYGRYRCTVHVFEPVPVFADRIEARFAANPDVVVHPYGLADRSGDVTMTLDADRSSVGRPGAHSTTAHLEEAATAFAELGLDRADLVKINIEGGEYDLLEHLVDTGWIGRLDHLQIQFHRDVDNVEGRIASVRARLEATHVLDWRYELIWESWHRRGAPPAAR